jgi:hypothetical protein
MINGNNEEGNTSNIPFNIPANISIKLGIFIIYLH